MSLPFEIEIHREESSGESSVRARKIFVDTKEHLLEVFDNDQLVCVFPITPGSTTLPAPVGTWKSWALHLALVPLRRSDAQSWRPERDITIFRPGQQPGRESLDGPEKPGIGIHGTNNPETIGRAASHGCIRLANWDARADKDSSARQHRRSFSEGQNQALE